MNPFPSFPLNPPNREPGITLPALAVFQEPWLTRNCEKFLMRLPLTLNFSP